MAPETRGTPAEREELGVEEVRERRESTTLRLEQRRARRAAPAIDEQTREIVRRRLVTREMHRRGWLVRRALVGADVVGLYVAFIAGEAAYQGASSPSNTLGLGTEFLLFAAMLPLWLVAANLYGLYDRDETRADHSSTDDIVRVFHLVTVVAWALVIGAYFTHLAHPAFRKVAVFWVFAILLVTLLRITVRAVCRRRFSYLQNTVIVGAGDVGQLLAAKILRHPEYGINLVGFIDDRPKEPRPDLDGLTLLGSPDELGAIASELDIERVIIAFSNDSTDRTIDLVRSLDRPDIQVDVVPRLFDLVGPSCEIHSLEGIPLLGIPTLRLSRVSRSLKRALDVAVSALSMLLLFPLFCLVAAAIKLDTPGPVFFRQKRMGEEGRPFLIFKFRTMVVDAEARKQELVHLNKHAAPGSDPRMFKIPDDPRITRVGKILRRYSLDELPQLINVFEGKMSLVGPRPLIPEESQYVDRWARKRMDLKPGITGLWQVLGRSDIPFEEMVKLDYLYVTTWSLWQDISLMFRTIPVAAGTRGGSY